VQLLVGHLDTVWPVGTLADMPVDEVGGRLYGPGVFDMKGGLVQMLFALRALRELSLVAPATPVVFVASDEETGSSDSTGYLERLARTAARAFVLEPAFGPSGKLKTERKAAGRFTLAVTGRAAHAGVSPGEGVSAILELSHQIQRLFALNDPDRGITVNVGAVDGGVRPNVVAPTATASIDVRVRTEEDGRLVEAALRSLSPVQEGASVQVVGSFGRPPMARTARNRALWLEAKRIGTLLGLSLDEERVGGASDGNLTSLYTATLDGLGPIGDGAHAEHEHVEIARLPERAALLALLLLAPLRLTKPTARAVETAV
jgi:glutamate carboxypeptidase